MAFGWKVLIPINLVWIMAVSSIHVLRDRGWEPWKATLLPLAIVLLIVVVPALMVLEGAQARRAARQDEDDETEAALEPTFPVPPMDLVVPTGRKARPMAGATVGPAAPASIEKGDDSDE
jgi:NADH-quinone oxidoreductase subunit H